MEVKIRILDVGDADAILVHLKKEAGELLFVIDGGRAHHWKSMEPELEEMLADAGKVAPDFILCTHYDADHIGGLTSLVEKYGKAIPKVWVFRTSERFDLQDVEEFREEALEDEHIFPRDNDTALGGEVGYDELYETSLRNLEHEIKFNKLLRDYGIPLAEPIAGEFLQEGWEELQVIGPTKEYYEKLFPAKASIQEILEETVSVLRQENMGKEIEDGQKSAHEILDSMEKSKITATNLNSAMLMLTDNDKKYLFAADAGIDSFLNIPDHKLQIADLFWLKVPHHGSKNNLNSDLIKLMRPKFAVLSGNSHVSDAVLNCFREEGTQVHCTRDDGNYSCQE